MVQMVTELSGTFVVPLFLRCNWHKKSTSGKIMAAKLQLYFQKRLFFQSPFCRAIMMARRSLSSSTFLLGNWVK
jgi:hypothetical protein